jgi:endonuclease/exonuclease/phosphatase family metal-dependent hydrolase
MNLTITRHLVKNFPFMLTPQSTSQELLLGFEKEFVEPRKEELICHEKMKVNGVRLMTYNVSSFTDIYDDNRYSDQIRAIIDIDPDILALQSCPGLDNIEKYYAPIISFLPYYHQVSDGTGTGTGASGTTNTTSSASDGTTGNILFSKYPILETRSVSLPAKVKPRSACNIKIKIGESKLSIWTLELDSHDDSGAKRKEALLMLTPALKKDLDNRYLSIIMGTLNYVNPEHYSSHELQWYYQQNIAILTAAAAAAAAVSTAPIGSGPQLSPSALALISGTGNEYKILKSLGFIDSFIISNQLAPKATAPCGKNVDMILYSDQVKIRRNWIYRITPSKHFPIISDLQLYT